MIVCLYILCMYVYIYIYIYIYTHSNNNTNKQQAKPEQAAIGPLRGVTPYPDKVVSESRSEKNNKQTTQTHNTPNDMN